MHWRYGDVVCQNYGNHVADVLANCYVLERTSLLHRGMVDELV